MRSLIDVTIDKYLNQYIETIEKQIPTNDRLAYELSEIACKAFLPVYNRARGSKRKRFEKALEAADKAAKASIESLLLKWGTRAKSSVQVAPVVSKGREAENPSVMSMLAKAGKIKYARRK